MPPAMFTARDLSQKGGSRVLFTGVNIDLARGEALVVRGRSGSGKTRLLRLLAWLDPGEGEVRLDGRTPVDWGVPSWRAQVAYVPQAPPVMPGVPRDLAARVAELKVHADMGDALEIARDLGLTDEQWTTAWQGLSGGERQRAHLAITLATHPRVLLLDEPTSALDAAAAAAVEALTAPFARVWVTHDAAQGGRVGDAVLEIGR